MSRQKRAYQLTAPVAAPGWEVIGCHTSAGRARESIAAPLLLDMGKTSKWLGMKVQRAPEHDSWAESVDIGSHKIP